MRVTHGVPLDKFKFLRFVEWYDVLYLDDALSAVQNKTIKHTTCDILITYSIRDQKAVSRQYLDNELTPNMLNVFGQTEKFSFFWRGWATQVAESPVYGKQWLVYLIIINVIVGENHSIHYISLIIWEYSAFITRGPFN